MTRRALVLITLSILMTAGVGSANADETQNEAKPGMVTATPQSSTSSNSTPASQNSNANENVSHYYFGRSDQELAGAAQPLTANDLNNLAAGHHLTEAQIRSRPLLFFRRWMNHPPRVMPMTLFILAFTVVISEVMSTNLTNSRDMIRKHFWRSFVRGMVTVLLALSFVRPLILSDIGMPLAVLIIGVVELVALIGLCVTVTLIGDTCLQRLSIADSLAKKPFLKRFTTALVGTTVAALILLLPGIGNLPPIGPRLLSLFCVLGTGSLLRSRFGTLATSTAKD